MNKIYFRTSSLVSASLLLITILISKNSPAQCTVLSDAIQGISYTYVQTGGTNASGVAYNPSLDIYYACIAGNPGFPYETFDASGNSLYQTLTGFDFRGLWWNPNLSEVEGNGYFTYGLWTSDLDGNGYALSTGTNLFTGQNQPSDQSCGDYDYDANEIIYYYNGSIYRYDRTDDSFIGSYILTGSPVPISNFNWTSVIYTGCCGNEIGLEDYINKTIVLFNKSNGAYSATSQLPSSAITNDAFRLSYANNLVWLYDVNFIRWTSYSIFSGNPASGNLNIGNDTSLCVGSSLQLTADLSGYEYEWSTGSQDSFITVNSGGLYWVTATNGNCVYSDSIQIMDTICAPPISFVANDSSICQKFCISFYDSSTNNPTSWQWSFPGGNPSSSTQQNPTNVCYNDPGVYDVTLITSSASGNDTLTLSNYVTVYETPPFPTITQNGYELTSSPSSAYQWQINGTDIPGATDQSYSVTETGFYTVLVSDENGCKNSATVYVEIVGINELNSVLNISVFPNPGNGNFTIKLTGFSSEEPVMIEIENSIGQRIYSSKEIVHSDTYIKEVGLENISAGIYLIQITSGDYYSGRKLVISQ